MSDKLHVVLCLNDAEPSKYAFDWALKNLLSPEKHRVTILSVVEPPIQAGYYYAASAAMYSPTFIDEVYKKSTEDAASNVREFQRELEKHFDNKIGCEMVVGRGEVRDEIVDYVESVKADMLVMGSRDLGTLKR
jgi:nucleotide-binding universal stress UspA family protein